MSTATLLLPALLLLPSLLADTAATESRTITVSSTCQGSCGGVDIPYPFGCCNVDILPELTGISFAFLNIRQNRPKVLQYSPCDYAFIVDKETYTFQNSDLLHMDRTRTMPVRLDWAIREMSWAGAKNTTTTTTGQYALSVDAPVSTTLPLSPCTPSGPF